MQPEFSCISYATSSHREIGKIITFAQFEEVDLVENERNAEKDESILFSIDELSIDDEYDDGYISTNSLEDIRDGGQIHPYINSIDARFKHVTVFIIYKKMNRK